jgi:putative ABC transport system permease protein
VRDFRFWRWLLRRRRDLDEDFARELEVHFDLAREEYTERGLSRAAATRAAQSDLGSITYLREEMREMWGWMWLERLVQDARYALRLMQKSPGFAAIAVLTLAIGIGANTAIFSVVDRLFFRPFPFPDPDRLVAVHELLRISGPTRPAPVSLAHFLQWRQRWGSVEDVAVIGGLRMSLTSMGDPERLETLRVSANLFSLIGIQPQLGRTFAPEEDQTGHDHVLLLSDEFWRRRLNADPAVVGRMIALNDELYEIVGVLPPFPFPKVSELFPMAIATTSSPQIWKPLGATRGELAGTGFSFACLARLKPGVTTAQARSALNALQETLPQPAPGLKASSEVTPLVVQVAGRVRSGLTLMWAAVGAVLLIGCVNMANLLLARTSSRRREMAIRTAIGATRGRLVRQVLVESLVMSVIGGVVGIAAAFWMLHMIVATAPADLPRVNEVQIDPRVLTFAVCTSLLAGTLVGVLPAWRLGVLNPIDALKSGAISMTSARKTGRLRALLVACEVSVSVMCLAAGGLLLHSFWRLLSVDGGFAADRVLTVDVSLPIQRYATPAARSTFIRTVLEGVQRLPGVVAAGVSNKLPLTGEGGNAALWPERSTAVAGGVVSDVRLVSPDFFRTLGIPGRGGRLFTDTDRERGVAVVSTVAGERLWPGEDPIGRQFHIGARTLPAIQVVGVVGDVHGASLDRVPSPTVYVPYWQSVVPAGVNSMDLVLVARTTSDPMAISSTLRRLIRELDPQLALSAFRTMDDVVTDSLEQRRFQLALVLLFAAAGMLLASLGIYGVVSYSVAQRTNEMGIRLALGALPGDIRRLVITQGFTPVLVGLGIGVFGSVGVGRLLGTLLFGVRPSDPLTLAVVIAAFVVVALAAMYVPAQRAIRVDPVQALRQD